MAVQQVRPREHFPSGDSRALIEVAFDPAEMSRRYRLSFEEGYDDLDRYQRAAIRLRDGSQGWLLRYAGEQGAGTTVYVDAAADLGNAKKLLLWALSLRDEDIVWATPALAAGAGV